jgi:hypothetical protein
MELMATLSRDKPIIVFEHGLGASDYYNTEPQQIFELFVQLRFVHLIFVRLSPKKTFVHQGGVYQDIFQSYRPLFRRASLSILTFGVFFRQPRLPAPRD